MSEKLDGPLPVDVVAQIIRANRKESAGHVAELIIEALRPTVEADRGEVERVARAICGSKGINPDCLYQHNFEGDWPEDDRREYKDAFTGEMRTMLFHKAWRHSEKAARAAIAALSPPLSVAEAVAGEREACAKLADAEYAACLVHPTGHGAGATRRISKAIRARGGAD